MSLLRFYSKLNSVYLGSEISLFHLKEFNTCVSKEKLAWTLLVWTILDGCSVSFLWLPEKGNILIDLI